MSPELKQKVKMVLEEIKAEQSQTLDFLQANKHYDGVDSYERVKERQDAFREGFMHGVAWLANNP